VYRAAEESSDATRTVEHNAEVPKLSTDHPSRIRVVTATKILFLFSIIHRHGSEYLTRSLPSHVTLTPCQPTLRCLTEAPPNSANAPT